MEAQFFEFLKEENTEKLFKFLLVECGFGMGDKFVSFRDMDLRSFFRIYAGLRDDGKFSGIGKSSETYLFSGPDRYLKKIPVITKSNSFAVECVREWTADGKKKWISKIYGERPENILFDMNRWYDSFDSDVMFTWFGKLEIRRSKLDNTKEETICRTFGYFFPCVLYACHMQIFSEFPHLSEYVLNKRTMKQTAEQIIRFFTDKEFGGFFFTIETTPDMDKILKEHPCMTKLISSYDETSDVCTAYDRVVSRQNTSISTSANHMTIWQVGLNEKVLCVRNIDDEEKVRQLPEFEKQINNIMMVTLTIEKVEMKICVVYVASKRKTAGDISIFTNDVMLSFSDYIFVGDFNTIADEARSVIYDFSTIMNTPVISHDPTVCKTRSGFQTQLAIVDVTDCSQKDFIVGENVKETKVFDLSGKQVGKDFVPNIPSDTNNPDHFLVMAGQLALMNIAVDNSCKLEYCEEKTAGLNKKFKELTLSKHVIIGSLFES